MNKNKLDNLWAPWRMDYIQSPTKETSVFLSKGNETNDKENLVLFRGSFSYVLMNLYPYNNGHLLIVPYEEIESPEGLSPKVTSEMMLIATESMKILRLAIKAEGFNFGANIGASAGAGIAEHLHYHIVPRWNGDTNFMPVIGNTKVQVQGLQDTYKSLLPFFKKINID